MKTEEARLQQLERSRNWKAANPERHAELARAYRMRNPGKTKAQNQLNYAIRSGKMQRGVCEVCGTDKTIHAHHHDYSKPFDVKWLCFQCHKKAHPVTDEDKAVKFSEAKRAHLCGSENSFSKLTEQVVREIKLMLSMGISQTKIAQVYDVSQVNISRIKRGKIWQHVAEQ